MHSRLDGYFLLTSCYCVEERCASKRKADIKSVSKWLTYCVVIGFKVFDQGKCYCQKESKDNDLLWKGRVGCMDTQVVGLMILTRRVNRDKNNLSLKIISV